MLLSSLLAQPVLSFHPQQWFALMPKSISTTTRSSVRKTCLPWTTWRRATPWRWRQLSGTSNTSASTGTLPALVRRESKREQIFAQRTRQVLNELDVFHAKGFNASSNSYRIEAQTQLKLDKEKTAWAFLHFTLRAAFWGLQEECCRNQCVLISYNPPRNSPVSQIVSTLIKGPPLLS